MRLALRQLITLSTVLLIATSSSALSEDHLRALLAGLGILANPVHNEILSGHSTVLQASVQPVIDASYQNLFSNSDLGQAICAKFFSGDPSQTEYRLGVSAKAAASLSTCPGSKTHPYLVELPRPELLSSSTHVLAKRVHNVGIPKLGTQLTSWTFDQFTLLIIPEFSLENVRLHQNHFLRAVAHELAVYLDNKQLAIFEEPSLAQVFNADLYSRLVDPGQKELLQSAMANPYLSWSFAAARAYRVEDELLKSILPRSSSVTSATPARDLGLNNCEKDVYMTSLQLEPIKDGGYYPYLFASVPAYLLMLRDIQFKSIQGSVSACDFFSQPELSGVKFRINGGPRGSRNGDGGDG